MKKSGNYLFLFLVMYFIYTINVSAALGDYSNGTSGNIGGLGGGEWYSSYVGLKISIVDHQNNLEDVEIFINKDIKDISNTKIAGIMKPKTHYGDKINISWGNIKDIQKTKKNVHTNKALPSDWLVNNTKIDMYDKLTANNYVLLLNILQNNFESLEDQYAEDHYILVEPMTYIGGYFGTAFELLNAFAGDVRKCDKFFCYWYTGAVFGGDSQRKGVLYDTLYTNTKIITINKLKIRNITNWIETYISDSKESGYVKRNRCLKSRACGRGIGVFKLSEIKKENCKDELKALTHKGKATPANLDKLYKKYEKKGKKYSQLLNYEKPSCSNKKPETPTPKPPETPTPKPSNCD